MGVVVTFVPADWKAQFPEFAYLSDQQATNYFNMATGVQRNDGGGPICVASVQLNMLNVLTAHVAALFAPTSSGAQPSPIVGRISDATQGSVSVGTQNDYPPGTVQWFQQTRYGSMWYVMSAPYRTMRYVPNPRSPVNAGIYGIGGLAGTGWVAGPGWNC